LCVEKSMRDANS